MISHKDKRAPTHTDEEAKKKVAAAKQIAEPPLDSVEEASLESFPSSDPPGWISKTAADKEKKAGSKK